MPKRYINYDYLRVKIEIISAFSYNNNWIKMCFWLSSFTSAIKGSEGQFPACLCGEGKVYVHERDECVVIDRSQCPVGSRKVNNKCICDSINDFKYEFDEIFWICRPWYIPTTPAPPKPCPAHQHRVGDSCEWDRCPSAYESKTGVFYWKFCEIVSNLAFWRRKKSLESKKNPLNLLKRRLLAGLCASSNVPSRRKSWTISKLPCYCYRTTMWTA